MRMILIALFIIFTLFGCEKLDVIGKYSITSFSNLVENENVKIIEDENYYAIVLEDGNSFGMSKSFSKELAHFYFNLDSDDFIQAGLEIKKLPNNFIFDDNSKMLKIEFKSDNNEIGSNNGVGELFKEIVKYKREIIGYHEELDHYGISLGDGFAYEWAKDLKSNDKDVVFVLHPQPFIDAGLTPENLKNWIYAKVKIKDDKGKPKEVYRLLKPKSIGE